MKKLIILILILIVGKFSFGQAPVTQFMGSPSTDVRSRGVLSSDSSLTVRTNFSDTSLANIGWIKNIAGTIIRAGGTYWYRNNAATAWVEFSSSAGGSQNLQQVTDIGSITTNRMTVYSGSDELQIRPDTVGFTKSSITSFLTPNTISGARYWKLPDSSGTIALLQNISIPTLQQVLTAGSTLTTDNTIDVGANELAINSTNAIRINGGGTGIFEADVLGSFQLKSVSGSNYSQIASTTGQTVGILSYTPTKTSGFTVSPDSIYFTPFSGQLNIGSLRSATDTTEYKPLVIGKYNRSVRELSYWPGGNGGSGSSSDINTFADLTTSIVDEEGFYNGFPWPIMRGDTIIIYLKHSTEHANAGTMRIYKSFNGGRTWNTTGNVTVDGVEIQCTSIQNGIFNDTIHIAYTKDADYDTLFYAKGTSGGIDFYGAGYVTYQTGWVGSPSIQSMFTLVSDTIFSPQYEIDTDSSKAFLNYYVGGVWRRGTTVLTQTNAAFPEGRTSEWYAVVTEQGTMDANTKLAMLFRREDGSYYLFASTSNGFTTVTRDNTNLFYEMGNQGAAAPIMMINVQGIIYIVCGNRRINSTYAIEYVTSPAASFFTNTQSAYSKVRKLYASTAATKAAAIDFGYPLPFQYNNKPYIAFYDVSPVYHSSGEGDDDDVRSISFPLLDRGYSEKYNDANQSITDSTQTLVSYPDLLLDCMGSWDWDGDANTTDTVWEAKQDGWYMVNAIATFEANGTGSYRQMYVIVVDPGVNTTATNQMISKTTISGNSSIADFNRVECNGMAYIKQGEQVKVYVKHDATSALNLLNTSRETMATVKITLVR